MKRETYWPLWACAAAMLLLALCSGCTYYNPRTGTYLSVFKKVEAEGITISTNGLSVKNAKSSGDAEMFRAVFEAGLATGKKLGGVP
jgi:hypothetical protein